MFEYSIIILCGGLGKRFGSDKVFYQYEGQTLLERRFQQIFQLTKQPNKIVLSVRDEIQIEQMEALLQKSWKIHKLSTKDWQMHHNEEKTNLKIHIISDILHKDRAPIVGLYSVFKEHPNTWFQILPIDTPHFTPDVLQQIYSKYLFENKENIDAFIPRWSTGYMEPLHGLYFSDSFVEGFKNLIDKNQYKIRLLFIDNPRIFYWTIEDFLNANHIQTNIFENFNVPRLS